MKCSGIKRKAAMLASLASCSVILATLDAANQTAFAAKPAKGKGAASSQSPVGVANAFIDQLAAGKFTQSTNYLDPSIRPMLPAPKLQLTWQALTAQYGAYKLKQPARTETMGSATFVFIPVIFGTKLFDFRVVFQGKPKIVGFFVEAHRGGYKEAPSVQSKTYAEQKIKVGSGKWQLDGVLTMPRGDGPFPAVVLVHGSGPQDMDESIGPNKPFRDLAHGLASRGVAVLRYEKRTKQHGKELIGADLKKLTVKEETIEDAVEAAKLLRNTPKIDKTSIAVLGHSLGGSLIPRIAAADHDIRGFILMAGSNEPIEDAIIRQTQYIAGLTPASAETEQKMAMLKDQVVKIKNLKSGDANSDALILGAGPAYWLDLKAHDPLAEIKDVDRPMLFLQGGRDYQVTADGDFARWKTAVKEAGKETNCQFKLYPQLNHLFYAGTGKCTPDEYLTKTGNVDESVMTDISTWVKNLGKSG